MSEVDAGRELVRREALLLDDGDLDGWLNLYSSDAWYWVPHLAQAELPRLAVNLVFDDRDRMEDRVRRLRSGYAHAQDPPSRTLRHLSEISLWTDDRDDPWAATLDYDIALTCTFLIAEGRPESVQFDRVALLVGRAWHFVRLRDDPVIAAKRVRLLAPAAFENITFIL